LQTPHENVYALGDATTIAIPGRWKADVPMMLPKAGVFAHAQAEVVARRIAAEVAGATVKAVFCGDGYCMLEAGEDLAGFAYGNFFAEPAPQIQLRQMGGPGTPAKSCLSNGGWPLWTKAKLSWLAALTLGGKGFGVPVFAQE
jgi:hypothetical protein